MPSTGIGLLLAALLLTTAGCGAGAQDPRAQGTTSPSQLPPVASSPSNTTASTAPYALPTPASSAPGSGPTGSGPPDPEAPARPSVAQRPGNTAPKVGLRSSDGSKLIWEDGVSLTIARVRRTTTGGTGPGSIPGRPETVVWLKVRNRSTSMVDLLQVVVSMPYDSSPPRLAAPVYDDATHDFSDRVAPGGVAGAVYGFAVPTGRRADLVVDLDGNHVLGTLTKMDK